MCQFIETLRIEKERIVNLEAHNQRMNETIRTFFPQASKVDLKKHIVLQKHIARTKCHIEYNNTILSISYQPYYPRQVHSLQLTECDTINYSYKYKDRSLLQLLYNQRRSDDDILIVKNGFITDTSIANIAVYDGIQWYTPAHPLLRGTQRAILLQRGIVKEKDITPQELFNFQKLCTINSMLDFEEMEFKISNQTIR
ncbi:MAG: aminotransferase class IV [Prevotella sp.]|jgi:4-amino-4-deoxychorismate lyase|nr:aminotransferase class IV [Prevotella sp.]MCH4242558.1 aminotransferase class IV [Prevotella sp.]